MVLKVINGEGGERRLDEGRGRGGDSASVRGRRRGGGDGSVLEVGDDPSWARVAE
jgi:hypothetical protein